MPKAEPMTLETMHPTCLRIYKALKGYGKLTLLNVLHTGACSDYRDGSYRVAQLISEGYVDLDGDLHALGTMFWPTGKEGTHA